MAIHHDYSGREDDDPGRWYPFRNDPDTGKLVEVRFRQMAREKARELDKKYRKPVEVHVKGKLIERLEVSTEKPKDGKSDAELLMEEVMDWCWLDVRNFEIAIHSSKTLALFVQEFDDPSLHIDDLLYIDGKLTPPLRRYCVDVVRGLNDALIDIWSDSLKHLDITESRQHDERKEKALERNLSSGSPTPSDTEASPTAAPAAETVESSDEVEASLASLPVS